MNQYQNIVMGDVFAIKRHPKFDMDRLIHGTTVIQDVFLSLCLFSTEACPKRFIDLYKKGQQERLIGLRVEVICVKEYRFLEQNEVYYMEVSEVGLIIIRPDEPELLMECPIEAMEHFRLI